MPHVTFSCSGPISPRIPSSLALTAWTIPNATSTITSGWPASSATEKGEPLRSALENPIRRLLGVWGHNEELLTHEAPLRTIFQVVDHRLIVLGHRASEPIHLKRPHRACGASTATFQLARLIQIANANT